MRANTALTSWSGKVWLLGAGRNKWSCKLLRKQCRLGSANNERSSPHHQQSFLTVCLWTHLILNKVQSKFSRVWDCRLVSSSAFNTYSDYPPPTTTNSHGPNPPPDPHGFIRPIEQRFAKLWGLISLAKLGNSYFGFHEGVWGGLLRSRHV